MNQSNIKQTENRENPECPVMIRVMRIKLFGLMVLPLLCLTMITVKDAEAKQNGTVFIDMEGNITENHGPVNVEDSIALVAIYYGANGDFWHNNSGWLTDNISGWHGIVEVTEVAQQDWRVTAIELIDNNLTGFLVPEISDLHYLERLDVSNNRLMGHLSDEIGDLPYLQELVLSNNEELEGEIPHSFFMLENMKRFWFDGTGIMVNPYQEEINAWLAGIEDLRTSLYNPAFTFETGESHQNVTLFFDGSAVMIEESEIQDGEFESLQWLVDGQPVSEENPADLLFPQGTTSGALVVTFEEQETDTMRFQVNVHAAKRNLELANPIAGISLIGEDYLFIPMDDGLMQVMDSGFQDRFDVSVGGELRSVSSISRDTVMYLSSTDRHVYSFRNFGIPLWVLSPGGDLQASPTVDEYRDRIYVGLSNRNILAFNRADGDFLWRGSVDESPVVHAGVMISEELLLMVTGTGVLYVYDLDESGDSDNKAPLVHHSTGLTINSAPAVAEDGGIILTSSEGQIYKFNLDLSTNEFSVAWNRNLGAALENSPVIGYDGTIYIGDSEGSLHVLNGDDGSELQRTDLGSPVLTTASINDYGVIYVGTEDGKLHALDESGQEIWHYAAESAITGATAHTGSSILFATTDGDLYNIYDSWRYLEPGNKMALAEISNKRPQWGTYLGNFRRTGSTIVGMGTDTYTEKMPDLPSAYSLHQNYPNPFNPSTQIRFELPEQTHVTLAVFNPLGQQVTTLVNEIRSAGRHDVTFDAGGLSSGLYIYRLEADGYVETKSMMYVK